MIGRENEKTRYLEEFVSLIIEKLLMKGELDSRGNPEDRKSMLRTHGTTYQIVDLIGEWSKELILMVLRVGRWCMLIFLRFIFS